MLRSSMQVKYPANRNMSETSASYQADDATELVNRTVSIYLICFTCNTFSICLSGYLAAPVAQTLNCCSHEDWDAWKAVINCPYHCFPFFLGKHRMSGSLRGNYVSANVRDASPYRMPHNFAATETNNCFLFIPHVNCAYRFFNFRALKTATSHKQIYSKQVISNCPWTNLFILSLQAFMIAQLCAFCLQFRIMWSSKSLPIVDDFFKKNYKLKYTEK